MRPFSASVSLPVVFVGFLVLLACGCAEGAAPRSSPDVNPPPAAPTPLGPHEGERVVAVVESLERAAHEEWLEYPDVIVSNVVAFGILQPQRFDTMLFAHVRGHPRIAGRPLLLGDAVSFVLPPNWRNRDLALDELEGLAFVEPSR